MKTPIPVIVAVAALVIYSPLSVAGETSPGPGAPRFSSLPALLKAKLGLDATGSGSPSNGAARRRGQGSGRFGLGSPRSRDERRPGDAISHPLPTFTRTFEYNGVTYTDRFVGSDPARRPQTTTIHTVIMPLRLDFGGGIVLDPTTDLVGGRTPLDWTVHSPVFTKVDYFDHGVPLGRNQFADELIRESFWSEGGNDPRFHVNLDPVVLPVQTLVVPPDMGSVANQLINNAWLGEQTNRLMSQLNPDPSTLVVIIAGYSLLSDGYAAAFHGATPLATRPNGPLQTYIVTLWTNDWSGGLYDPEIGIDIGHEVAEWLCDPFNENEVPPWTFYGSHGLGLLEVGDPFEFEQNDTDIYFLTTTEGTDYLMPDVAYFDWFTRRTASRGLDGYYSFNGQPTFSQPTYDMSRYDIRQFDVPGATSTILTGINSRGDLTGYFYDQNYVEHGLLQVDGKLRRFDLSGASATFPIMLNANGTVIGDYIDASGYHEFLYQNGRVQTVEPFTDASVALNSINDAGDIVGTYYPASESPGAGGFLIHRGVAQKIMPLGAPNAAILAISRSGQLAGVLDVDGDSNFDFGFAGKPGNFEVIDYAGPAPLAWMTKVTGISDNGDLSGTLVDLTSATNGFYRNRGVWDRIGYGRETRLKSMNESGVAVGYATPRYWPYHGIIVTPRKRH